MAVSQERELPMETEPYYYYQEEEMETDPPSGCTGDRVGTRNVLSIPTEALRGKFIFLQSRQRKAGFTMSLVISVKGYDSDTQQCRVKIKELRQVQEVNHRSGGAPKTCRFYKELNAILGSNPTSIADSPVDTLEEAKRGANLQSEILDEEVELEEVEETVVLPAGSPGGAGREELFSTPEVLNREQETDESPAFSSCIKLQRSHPTCNTDSPLLLPGGIERRASGAKCTSLYHMS
ncbi:hypothetical protein UY3_15221 [Chelonia mydas]|uniref:Uncharacterized protein n=1 Tax=Chelonia mydas TaxID=8469 RepID=M7AQT2_CHEMY|nr:hypothetical protein UY3_15221 [Chelonia mydas]